MQTRTKRVAKRLNKKQMIMKKNIGKTDGIIRLIMVALLIFFYFILNLEGTLGLVVLLIAFLLCVTVFTGVCPLYYLFGINTRKQEK